MSRGVEMRRSLTVAVRKRAAEISIPVDVLGARLERVGVFFDLLEQRVELLVQHRLVIPLVLDVLLELVAALRLFLLYAADRGGEVFHGGGLRLNLVRDDGAGDGVDAQRGVTARTLYF